MLGGVGVGLGDYSDTDRMVSSWDKIQWPKFEALTCFELRVNPNWWTIERAGLRQK